MPDKFWLTIQGTQRYEGQEPEQLELITEAEMTHNSGVITLSYAESELTGLKGTLTTFEIHPHKVILRRRGLVNNEMEFVQGSFHRSLYDMGEGALMITIHTTRIEDRMTLTGGSLRIAYDITVERLGTGTIEYLLPAKPAEE